MTYPSFILTLSCVDVKGIVAAVSGFLTTEQCNILESAQYFDSESGRFFLRTVFASEGGLDGDKLKSRFVAVAARFGMSWHLQDCAHKPAILILVSKFGHCLQELLYQHRQGTLPCQIAGIVSNHADMADIAAFYDVPYHYFPVSKDTKAQQEALIASLVDNLNVELVVLARYMQILSASLSQRLHGKAMNIHHSFLPSFKGAKPYHQAHERGVKVIGATAHYVTPDLDEGPIIEQETTRVSHAQSAETWVEIGRHLESLVLSRAVKYHLERRVVLNGHKTVVFS
jgi:formyltetrahydrofolate deformylase